LSAIKFLKLNKSKLLRFSETLASKGLQKVLPEILAAAAFQNKHSGNPIVFLESNNYAH
jgi:hypothetical protein